MNIKDQARDLVRKEIRNGRMVRPTVCPKCGRTDLPIVGHHPDYSKFLEVEWMCSGCHERHHHLGTHLTNEHKKHLSEATKGRPFTEEHIRNMTGLKRSEEQKKHISEALKGKPKSEKHKLHISESRIGMHLSDAHKQAIREGTTGDKNPFYGKHHTPETLEKIRQARKNYWKTHKITTIP